MPRPKIGTPGCEIATKKWRETMLKKYGGKEELRKKMQERGRKGGSMSNKGGFASDVIGKDGLTGRERAVKWGAVGGKRSSRKGVKNGCGRTSNKDIDAIERILEEESGRDNDAA